MVHLPPDMTRQLVAKKDAVIRKLFAVLLLIPAAILLFTAYVLGTLALLHWLEDYYPDLPAFLILSGGYAVLGFSVLIIAKWQSKPEPQPHVSAAAPAAGSADYAASAINQIAGKNLPMTLMATLMVGFVYGIVRQNNDD